MEVVRRLNDIPGLPEQLRRTSAGQAYHLCDNVAIDVNDPIELDLEERHYFPMIGHRHKREDEPSFYDLVEQDEVLRKVVRWTQDAERNYEEDSRPCGLLLRQSRRTPGTFGRVDCVVSRLVAGGWHTWRLVGKMGTVKII